MKTLVVLAAGQGSRLRPLTNALPKCLVEVGGRSILDRLLEHFRGWAESIVVVTGFESQQVADHLADQAPDLPVTLCSNPEFATTNSCYSAWYARDSWEDASQVVLTNADVLFGPDALLSLLVAQPPITLSVRLGPCDEEDMKVAVNADGRIRRVSKEIALDESVGEFTGVSLARGDGVARLQRALASLLEDPQMKQRGWYDLALDALAREDGLDLVGIPSGVYWEIDTAEDLAEVRSAPLFAGS